MTCCYNISAGGIWTLCNSINGVTEDATEIKTRRSYYGYALHRKVFKICGKKSEQDKDEHDSAASATQPNDSEDAISLDAKQRRKALTVGNNAHSMGDIKIKQSSQLVSALFLLLLLELHNSICDKI